MNTDSTERLNELAEIAAGLIQAQVQMSKASSEADLRNHWVLGYCFGFCDAISQKAKLDQYTDGLAMITFSFIKIFGSRAEGSTRLGIALDLQGDQQFVSGCATGGEDFFAWANDRQKTPLGLSKFLNSSTQT